MNAPAKEILDTGIKQKMLKTLQHQRDSYIDEGFVSAETRIDRIDRAIDILVTHSEAISEAMNEDFGCRPRETNLMTDVTGSIECLKHSKKHLKKMDENRKAANHVSAQSTGWTLLYHLSTKRRCRYNRALEFPARHGV